MPIKVTKDGGKQREIGFPKLMTVCNIIVLMVDGKNGTVIIDNEDQNYGDGRYWSNWDISRMKDYQGEIIISNEELK